MISKINSSRLNCGFLGESPNSMVLGFCEGLGSGWQCCPSKTAYWTIYHPDCELEFSVLPGKGNVYHCSNNFGLESESGIDYSTAKCWLAASLQSFNKINNMTFTTSLNSAIDRNELKIIKEVFKKAEEAVILPPGFRYRSFRENASENSVIGTLEYRGDWVTKSSLAADFEDNIWTFCPNYDPEGRGTNRVAKLHSTQDVRWQDVAYQMKVNPNSSVAPEKQIMFQLVEYLQEGVDKVIHDPPPRLYPTFWRDGILDDRDLTRMNKRGVLNLVRQGLVPGRKLLKARPELWRELFDEGYVTENDVFKTNPDKLFWLVSHGKLPPERALAVDPSLENKLRKAGIQIDDTVFESRTPEDILEAVRNRTLTPQKAWSLNPSILKDMVAENLISPDDAFRLDPKILNWMLINHYVGRAWAAQRKDEVRTKSELKKQGVDWETLESSRHGLSSSRHRLGFRKSGGKK